MKYIKFALFAFYFLFITPISIFLWFFVGSIAAINIDNRIVSSVITGDTSGLQSIKDDVSSVGSNLVTLVKDAAYNNILIQSVKSAVTDENKNIIDTVKEYISLDGKTDKVLETQSKEINGETNLTPEQVKESLNQIADIYNDNGDKLQGFEISDINGNIAGLSYVDKDGIS